MKKITSIFCISLLFSSTFAASTQKVIYGNDDRIEVESYRNPYIQKLAKAVAGRVKKFQFYNSPYDGYSNFDPTTLGERINACPSERFKDQPALASCTGFLVGDDLLVTAGHCMKVEEDCTSNNWVFDFTESTKVIADNSVYNCKEIVATEKISLPFIGTTDYAIIRLDRKVTDRSPLKFRTDGRIKNGTSVLMIGHPMGLPMKVANNATIKGSFGKTFKTNLDAYGGNSGSPVFDESTGLVEGILVQGAKDFTSYGDCSLSRQGHGHGEVVYKITRLKALQKLKEEGKL